MTRPVSALLATGFAAAAGLRRGKPIHHRGVLAEVRLVRRGRLHRRTGVPWLDEPGEHHGVARLSRSAGLPDPWPDVLGLALRLDGEAGDPYDLLLAGTALPPGLRMLPLPARRALEVDYCSLLPYSAAGRPVLLAASPAQPDGPLGRRRRGLPDELHRRPVTFDLLVASPLGPWEAFGWLELTPRRDEEPDGQHLDLRFDPVLNPLPGLPPTVLHSALRLPSYLAARRVTEHVRGGSGAGITAQRWGGRDSNPRPRDYESPALTG